MNALINNMHAHPHAWGEAIFILAMVGLILLVLGSWYDYENDI